METIVIESDKSTASILTKILKEMKGVARIKHLTKSEREDIAMTKAILDGETGKYIDTEKFLKKIRS